MFQFGEAAAPAHECRRQRVINAELRDVIARRVAPQLRVFAHAVKDRGMQQCADFGDVVDPEIMLPLEREHRIDARVQHVTHRIRLDRDFFRAPRRAEPVYQSVGLHQRKVSACMAAEQPVLAFVYFLRADEPAARETRGGDRASAGPAGMEPLVPGAISAMFGQRGRGAAGEPLRVYELLRVEPH